MGGGHLCRLPDLRAKARMVCCLASGTIEIVPFPCCFANGTIEILRFTVWLFTRR